MSKPHLIEICHIMLVVCAISGVKGHCIAESGHRMASILLVCVVSGSTDNA